VEVVNLYDLDAEFAPRFSNTVAGSMRIMGDSLQPVIAVGTPPDPDERAAVQVFVSAGLQYVPR
jgi:hypothetical protein